MRADVHMLARAWLQAPRLPPVNLQAGLGLDGVDACASCQLVSRSMEDEDGLLNASAGSARSSGRRGDENLPTQQLTASDVERLRANAEGECVICMEAYKQGDYVQRLPCLHAFHLECSQPWLRSQQLQRRGRSGGGGGPSCPVCKHSL